MTALGPNEYRCAQCGGVFEKGWTDQEAVAESKELWGDLEPAEQATICTACFQTICLRRIREEAFPVLRRLRREMLAEGRIPREVVLPANMNPGPYTGPDADPTMTEARMMGLPVTWGDRIELR